MGAFEQKAKNRDEESSSGIAPPEPTKVETLIEDLIEKEESAATEDQEAKKRATQEQQKAEDVRKKALERYGETKKRKLDKKSNDEDEEVKPKQRRNTKTQPLVDFLKAKAEQDKEVRQQEL